MSSEIKKQLQEIDQLIHNRNFTKAMTIIDGLLKKPKLAEIKLLELKLAKSHIFSELEQFDEGLQLADEVLINSEKLDDKLLIVDAIIAKLANLGVKEWWNGRLFRLSYLYYKSWDQITNYSKLIREGERILKTITSKSTKDLKKREALFFRMRGIIQRKKGQYESSIQFFEKSLKYFKSVKNDFEILQDLISISKTPLVDESSEQVKKAREQAKELIAKLKNDFYQVGLNFILMWLEEQPDVQKQYQDALQILKRYGDERNIAWLNFNFGGYFTLFKGDFDTGLMYYNKALALFETLKNYQGLAITNIRIANAYRVKGDFKLAFDYCYRGIAVCEQYDNKADLTYAYANLGGMHQVLGNLEKAMELFTKGLALCEQGYSDMHEWFLRAVGEIYLAKNDLEKAKEYFKKALETTYVALSQAQLLLQLVILALENDSIAEAQKYYQQFIDFPKPPVFFIVTQYKLLAEALILLKNQRISHKYQALKIFQEVAKDETTRFEVKITALLNICELLLLELRTTNNEDIIRELEAVINQLLTIAKEINSVLLFVEAYILQSKLAIISLDFDKAERLFAQAKELAKDRDLKNIVERIVNEQEAITKKIGDFNEFSTKEPSIVERLDHTGINGNIDHMKKKNLAGTLSEQEEDIVVRDKLFSLKL
jgi:tetratricopeptide (TPR) repeat protein